MEVNGLSGFGGYNDDGNAVGIQAGSESGVGFEGKRTGFNVCLTVNPSILAFIGSRDLRDVAAVSHQSSTAAQPNFLEGSVH